MDLTTTVSSHDAATVLAVQGDIDISTAPALSEALAALTSAPGAQLIVDLDGVGFLDSAALAALVGANKDVLAAGGSLAVVCPKEQLLRIFTITKLDAVLSVYPSLEKALAG